VPGGDAVGVALHDLDRVDVDSETVGDHLGIGGLVALAVRHGAEEGSRLALGVEADLGLLGPAAGDALGEMAEPDAAQLAAP
jgi:hypothetical protein